MYNYTLHLGVNTDTFGPFSSVVWHVQTLETAADIAERTCGVCSVVLIKWLLLPTTTPSPHPTLTSAVGQKLLVRSERARSRLIGSEKPTLLIIPGRALQWWAPHAWVFRHSSTTVRMGCLLLHNGGRRKGGRGGSRSRRATGTDSCPPC